MMNSNHKTALKPDKKRTAPIKVVTKGFKGSISKRKEQEEKDLICLTFLRESFTVQRVQGRKLPK